MHGHDRFGLAYQQNSLIPGVVGVLNSNPTLKNRQYSNSQSRSEYKWIRIILKAPQRVRIVAIKVQRNHSDSCKNTNGSVWGCSALASLSTTFNKLHPYSQLTAGFVTFIKWWAVMFSLCRNDLSNYKNYVQLYGGSVWEQVGYGAASLSSLASIQFCRRLKCNAGFLLNLQT